MPTIHLWEFAPSPHLGNVLAGLARNGFETRYVVYREAYESRKVEGWTRPKLPGVEFVPASRPDDIFSVLASSSSEDIHICVGLRGNEYVRDVTSAFRKTNRPFWIFMETIDERRWWGAPKRLLYRWLFAKNLPWLEGVLAAGASTMPWVVARGVPHAKVFEFAYFLNREASFSVSPKRDNTTFRLIFAGSLVSLKRVNLIIEALNCLPEHVVLDVVGDGRLRRHLEAQANVDAPGRVTFHGTVPMSDVANFMARADCLVLPSEHDGWGAVVSEALLVGTRVVCSDRCGASVVVHASGAGQVFETFTEGACTWTLLNEVSRGPVDHLERTQVADWARCLTDSAGAAYLEEIIAHVRYGNRRPVPTWHETYRKSGSGS